MRTGAAGLEAAQVIATQEEPVDDLLLSRKVMQVADAGRERDVPVGTAGEPVKRNVVVAVELGAEELRIAAEAGEIGAEPDDVAAMRLSLLSR